MYKIKYLSIAREDINIIITYISEHLKAPKAALALLDELEKSILRLEQFPYLGKVYQPIKELESEYRFFPVKNYIVFYIVKEKIVEIHRIIYSKMDLGKFIK